MDSVILSEIYCIHSMSNLMAYGQKIIFSAMEVHGTSLDYYLLFNTGHLVYYWHRKWGFGSIIFHPVQSYGS